MRFFYAGINAHSETQIYWQFVVVALSRVVTGED